MTSQGFLLSDQELAVRCVGPDDYGVMWWQLIKPLVYTVRWQMDGLTITVPAGFRTDFASVPQFLWSIFPPHGIYSRACVIHDFLYRMTRCSRFLADAIFREAMHQLGVSQWKRVAMYYAVRAFGWRAREVMRFRPAAI